MEDIKYAIIETKETVAESVIKDVVTGAMVSFCAYMSMGSTLWTVVSAVMIIVFLIHLVMEAKGRTNSFSSKKDLQLWVDSLEEQEPKD